jgi:acetylornithine deacetylase/succinyl-diaminopimelate desuccinylase-like protein
MSNAEAARLKPFVNRQRLVQTAMRLCAIPSQTGQAGPALDCLAEILEEEGFSVERPAADYPQAPAVAARFDSGQPGKTLQFNGHLDTVHLPFVAPAIEGDRMTGTGSSDMKAGTAAAVEAMRVLRDSGALSAGQVLLTAHDLHEAPWGDGRQLDALIRDGYVGHAVLIPEYLDTCIPVVGRGLATWRVTIRRPGAPIHEVMRPANEPAVIDAGAEVVARLRQLAGFLAGKTDPLAGSESVFVGQIHAGEIFNQYPQECWLEGTRRWLPGEDRHKVEAEFRALAAKVAERTGTQIDVRYQVVRDGFRLNTSDPFVERFVAAYHCVTGATLPLGAKPFCDDCNTFWSLAGIPAITHGPSAGGAHTLNEWVSVESLCRVAHVYAVTASTYCAG